MTARAGLAALLLVTASQARAATLKGIIVLDEIGGPPVANVQISAVDGANPVASGANGTFTLDFPRKQRGDPVRIVIQRGGYVVVNDIQLQAVLPSDPAAAPLVLLLCKQESREELSRRFYRLKSFEIIEETYQKKLRALEAKNQATERALEQLRRERDQAKDMAQGAAEQMSRLATNDVSRLYVDAMSLFLAGKVDEALALLDADKLERSAAEAVKRKISAEKAVRDVARSYTLKGQLLVSKLDLDGADKAYRAAIDVTPEEFAPRFNLAFLFDSRNRFQEAEDSYRACIDLARRSGNQQDLSDALNNLANLCYHQDRPTEARRYCEEALAIRRELARRDAKMLPRLTETLNNFGLMLNGSQRFDEAMNVYEEAIAIHRRLDRSGAGTKRLGFAKVLNNLGNLLNEHGRSLEAIKTYEEAVAIDRALLLEDPDTAGDLSAILCGLGDALDDQGRIVDAQRSYEESLEIARKAVQRNPQPHLLILMNALNAVGGLRIKQGCQEEARAAVVEGLTISRKLPASNRSSAMMVRLLRNLAAVERRQEHLQEAEELLREALAMLRSLAQQSPKKYLGNLADAARSLGDLFRDQNRMAEARTAYTEAIDAARIVRSAVPELYDETLANLLDDLGTIDRHLKLRAEAEKTYEEQLQVRRALARRHPGTYHSANVASTLVGIAFVHFEQDRRADGIRSAEEALEIFSHEAQFEPDAYLPKVASTHGLLGLLYQKDNRIPDARTEFQRAIDILERPGIDANEYCEIVRSLEKLIADLPNSAKP
jgi:tetratricopeptide (TPR) repeat protein